MFPTQSPRDKFDLALNELLAQAYLDGFQRGLSVAEKLAGYLTHQPQPKWAREMEEWARRDIEAATKRANRHISEVYFSSRIKEIVKAQLQENSIISSKRND